MRLCRLPNQKDVVPHLFKHLVLKTTLCNEGVLWNSHFKECGLGLKLLNLTDKREY